MANLLKCVNECGATAKDTSKERGRFSRWHPALCTKPKESRDIEYSKSLAEDQEIRDLKAAEDFISFPDGTRRPVDSVFMIQEEE